MSDHFLCLYPRCTHLARWRHKTHGTLYCDRHSRMIAACACHWERIETKGSGSASCSYHACPHPATYIDIRNGAPLCVSHAIAISPTGYHTRPLPSVSARGSFPQMSQIERSLKEASSQAGHQNGSSTRASVVTANAPRPSANVRQTSELDTQSARSSAIPAKHGLWSRLRTLLNRLGLTKDS